MADPTAYFYQSLQSSPFAGTDPVKGSLEVERGLSDLATAREARAGQRLNQQLTGLTISEFQEDAPLREAARTRALGQFRQLGEVPRLSEDFAPTPAMRLPEDVQALRTNLAPVWARLEQTNNLPAGFMDSLARVETTYGTVPDRGGRYAGLFQMGPDAAAEVGLPLDARTDPQKSSVGAASYAANVARQLRQSLGREVEPWEIYLGYQQGAGGARALLSNPQRPALEVLTSVYRGDERRARAALVQNGGSPNMTAGEFASLWQRKFTPAPVAQVSPDAARPQTQPRNIPNIPGMLGEAPMRLSAAGVPMTGVPEGDLTPTTGAQAQAGLSQSGTAQTPGGVTVQVPGTPAQTGGYPGLDYSNRGLGILQAIGGGIGSLFGSRFAGITGEGASAASAAPAVNLSAPSQRTLGGAAPTLAPTFGSTMAGGTGTAGALSPTPFAKQATQGLLPTAAQQQAQQQARQTAAGTTAGLGLEYFGPAQRILEQAAQQRAVLQQRLNATQYMSYETAMAERAKILAEDAALRNQVRDANVELAVGSLTANQTQPVNALLQQYGMAIQPRTANGRVTGYDVLRNGAVVNTNVPTEQIIRSVRENFSATAATAAARQREAQFDVVLDGLKKALEVQATTAGKIAEIEATARTRGFSQVTKRDNGDIVATDPATGDGFIYRQVDVPGGKRGEKRDEIVKVRANVEVR